jgi:hypothetical protein
MNEVNTQLRQIVEERAQIWKQMAQARGAGNELAQLAPRIPTATAQSRGPLTSTQTAPDELNAALRLVQQSLEKTAAIATAIQQKQTEITRLKKRDNFMLIGLVVAAIIGALILWAVLVNGRP